MSWTYEGVPIGNSDLEISNDDNWCSIYDQNGCYNTSKSQCLKKCNNMTECNYAVAYMSGGKTWCKLYTEQPNYTKESVAANDCDDYREYCSHPK